MLTPTQRAALTAAMDRIIPVDDYPSASQANVGIFIDRMLTAELRPRATELAVLLDAIDAAAMSTHGKPLAALAVGQQDDVLSTIDVGKSRSSFNWLVTLVTEGYYADPANGGNKDAISWRMIGYDPKVPGYNGAPTTRSFV